MDLLTSTRQEHDSSPSWDKKLSHIEQNLEDFSSVQSLPDIQDNERKIIQDTIGFLESILMKEGGMVSYTEKLIENNTPRKEQREELIRMHLLYIKSLRDDIASPLRAVKMLTLLPDTWFDRQERLFRTNISELHTTTFDFSKRYGQESGIGSIYTEQLERLKEIVKKMCAIQRVAHEIKNRIDEQLDAQQI